jgi:hypothetical protein
MATVTRTETKKRGILGRIFLLLFWIFNGLMFYAMIVGLGGAGEVINATTTEAERAGAAIGTAIGTGMLLMLWLAGAVILGLLVLLTPGKTIVTETVKD